MNLPKDIHIRTQLNSMCKVSGKLIVNNESNYTSSSEVNLFDCNKYEFNEADEIDFFTACALGEVEVMRSWLMSDMHVARQCNDGGWFGIHYCCYYGYENGTRLVMAAWPDALRVVTPDGSTPLILAVTSGYLNAAAVVLNEEVIDMRELSSGKTALYIAVELGNIELVKFLISCGASTNQIVEGKSMITAAAERGYSRVVRALLDGGADMSQAMALDATLTAKHTSTIDIITKVLAEKENLKTLLNELNLQKYWINFDRHKVNYKQFLKMKDTDLRQIGINLLGPRKKLLQAISNINAGRINQK